MHKYTLQDLKFSLNPQGIDVSSNHYKDRGKIQVNGVEFVPNEYDSLTSVGCDVSNIRG